LNLVYRDTGVDRLVLFTMAEHLSPAADNLDHDSSRTDSTHGLNFVSRHGIVV
jgi:hypothetical protein